MTLSQAQPATLHASPGESIEIVPVPDDKREEMLSLLLARDGGSDPDHARRFMQFAHAHAVALDFLYAAIDSGGHPKAVALGVPGAGRSAMFFANQPRSPAGRAMTARVLDAICLRLQEHDVHLAQALLDPDDSESLQAFLAARFTRLASLKYLERPLRTRLTPARPRWPKGVSVHRYDDSLRGELAAALEASYDQTLDCPGLLGVRDIDDVVAGHVAAGVFDPALWTLLRIDGRTQGVLLLNPSADHTSVELVYLGLTRAARGQGLGTQFLRHGLHLLAGRPERVMTLAVDQANAPALRLYRREHFRAVLERTAMIRSLRAATR